MRNCRRSAAVLLSAAIVAGCVSQTSRTTSTSERSSDETQVAVAPTIGHAAAQIAGEDIDGKPFKLSDYRGKAVMLDFWGNW